MTETPWTLGFIGAGVMAEVLIAGLRSEELVPPERILASDRRKARCEELYVRFGLRTTQDNLEVARAADLLVLSVKPQDLHGVLRPLHGVLRPQTVVLSIIAGARLGLIQRALGHERVVRCMPNLPCRIHRGMTVWTAAPEVSEADRARIRSILAVMGEEVEVDKEDHVDRATAVNGTGPAIVAQFVKDLLEAATFIGEPRNIAADTVLATIAGTAEMIRRAHQEGTHVAELIDEVTSPGGTTSRALQVMKKGGMSAVLTEAVSAAYERTLELGDSLEAQVDRARE